MNTSNISPTAPTVKVAHAAWRTGLGATTKAALRACATRGVTPSDAAASLDMDPLLGDPVTVPLGQLRVLGHAVA